MTEKKTFSEGGENIRVNGFEKVGEQDLDNRKKKAAWPKDCSCSSVQRKGRKKKEDVITCVEWQGPKVRRGSH